MPKVFAGLAIAGATLGGGSIALDASINPYQNVQVVEAGKAVSALQIAKTGSLPEEGAATTIVNTDKPRIELDKWGGEVKLGVTSMDLPANTTGARPFLSRNVDWGSGAETMEAVPLDATTTYEDGGMEININLASKPVSNVFTFQLDNWQNLDFFYQAPLWQENNLKASETDCDDTDCSFGELFHRPVNVVGSYAVYYKNHIHSGHATGQTNYATGKAYHIFRPLVSDNAGNTTWATLSYSNGVLSVTVPQSFLDSAAYPVKVDPTFGYTTVGASNGNCTGTIVGDPAIAPANGTVNDMQVHWTAVGAQGNQKTAFYNSDHTFNTGSTERTANADVGSWDTYTISLSITNGTTYYQVLWCAGTNMQPNGDTGSSGNYNEAHAYVAGGDSWPSLGTPGSTVIKSIYADYTAGGGTNTLPTVQINSSASIRGTVIIP